MLRHEARIISGSDRYIKVKETKLMDEHKNKQNISEDETNLKENRRVN